MQNMKNKAHLLFQISRPLYGIIFMVSFAYCLLLAQAKLDSWVFWLQAIWLTIPSGIILFGLNDIYDYPSDVKNPRKGGKWGTILHPRYHLFVFHSAIVSSILFLLIGFFSQNLLNIICTVLLLAIAWGYSVPPIRLKTKPPMEFFTNIAGAFVLSLLAFSWGSGVEGFAKIITGNIILAQICWGIALALLSFLADYEEDKQAGDFTTVHLLGKRKSIFLSAFFYAMAASLTVSNPSPIFPFFFCVSTILGIWLFFKPQQKNIPLVYHLNWYLAIISIIFSICITGIVSYFT